MVSRIGMKPVTVECDQSCDIERCERRGFDLRVLERLRVLS